VVRLCVRALAPSRGFPSGRPLPSARLVSFDGFIGTMNRSDSRPRLECELRRCLARIPRRGPIRRTRDLLDPGGPLMFRRSPSVHDPAFDPGGATPSRLPTAHMLPSLSGNQLGLRDLPPFEALSRTLHGSCLHFGPRVTATPARLGPSLPATALAGSDFHRQAIVSLA